MNALSAGGSTSLYDGLAFSLDGIENFDPDRPGLVYVLSDGGDNDSTATEASVIAAYQAAEVPIIAFAYGSFAPTGTLFKMANDTGGAFYASPTTLGEIQAALLSAEAQFSSNVLLSSTDTLVGAGATESHAVAIDSTLESVRLTITFSGAVDDLDLALLSPAGLDTGSTFLCEAGVSCTTTLDDALLSSFGFGEYQVQFVNNTGADKAVKVLASATPAAVETFGIAVGVPTEDVVYPEPLTITATITQGPAITGLDVVAEITNPSGGTSTVPLLDDGIGADQLAGDGTYSASIAYKTNGIYSAIVTASNASGTGETTFEGVAISLAEDGTAVVPDPTPITENFTRIARGTAIVSGVLTDDHANDPSGGACTAIADDNSDVAGRIDFAGDVDCFAVVPGSVADPIVLRATSLAGGIDPLLTIYDSTGSTIIAEADLSSSESPSSGVTLTLPPGEIDPAGLVLGISHLDAIAATGTYAVSAGTSLASDPPLDTDGDGITDDVDACPASDLSSDVILGACNCDVDNILMADGCTVADLTQPVALTGSTNVRALLSDVQRVGMGLKRDGVLDLQDVRSLTSCAMGNALGRCWNYAR